MKIWLGLPLVFVLVGCSGDGSTKLDDGNVENDSCLGTFSTNTISCQGLMKGQESVVLELTSIEGDVPAVLRTGTFNCATNPSTGLFTLYSNLEGDWPSDCVYPWSLKVSITKNETATELTANGANANPGPGKIGLRLVTEAESCSEGSYEMIPNGVGTVTLTDVPVEQSTCAHFALNAVELLNGTSSVRISGTLKVKRLPIGAP